MACAMIFPYALRAMHSRLSSADLDNRIPAVLLVKPVDLGISAVRQAAVLMTLRAVAQAAAVRRTIPAVATSVVPQAMPALNQTAYPASTTAARGSTALKFPQSLCSPRARCSRLRPRLLSCRPHPHPLSTIDIILRLTQVAQSSSHTHAS